MKDKEDIDALVAKKVKEELEKEKNKKKDGSDSGSKTTTDKGADKKTKDRSDSSALLNLNTMPVVLLLQDLDEQPSLHFMNLEALILWSSHKT